MDVVYICSNAYHNDELRHSLRTLEAHFPVDNLHFVGGPKWLQNVNIVPGDFHSDSKWTNLARAWQAIPHIDSLSDDFVYMNDDMYFLKDMDSIPRWHRGGLKGRVPVNNYDIGRMGVKAFLLEHEKPSLNYETHIPLEINKNALKETFDAWGEGICFGFQRTLYCNYNNVGGFFHEDVKVGDQDLERRRDIPDCEFISSDTVTWLRDSRFDIIKGRYKIPSQWENLNDDQ